MDAVVVQRRWPESVTVDWRRFACGLWREAEGDIRAACRLEDLPRAHTFKHEGQLYVPCGMIFRGTLGAEAWSHPIIRPEDYRGPEPEERSYEGRAVTVNRESFRLGPKIVFKSSEPSIAEWRSHLKILYADGGLFAAKPTYAGFLDSLTPTGSINQSEAVVLEKSEFGNRDKEAIRSLLKPKVADAFAQLSFEMKF